MRIDAIKHVAAALCCCAAMPFALAADGTVSVGTGFNYISGRYGTATTTDVTSIPFLLKYETADWTLKLTLPYLYVSGGTSVIPGVGGADNRNPRSRTASAEGLGDVVAAATYAAYYDSASALGVDLTGKVKFGTADRDKGLGTGENDYSAQVDVYKGYGHFTVFGGMGYTALGSSPYLSLNNVFNLTLGGAYKLNDLTTAGLTYDARERVTSTSGAMSEAMAYVSHKIDKHWKSQFYLLKGFETGSPEWGAGANINYAF